MNPFVGSFQWSDWVRGLVASFIGGGSGAFAAGLSSVAIDSNHFNIYTADFWKLMLGTFVISGLVPFFAYLHQQPLPDTVDKEHTIKVITQGDKDPITIDTKKETSTEKKDG